MAFSESFLTELVERNDIVDVVSGYVRLSKKSGSNMFGLCPFHSEKTPSFSVSPDKQIYHCFGCGKGGGVINFIMEIENLGFRDAVEFLARRAGMQMPEEENDKESQKRARMLALNKDAAHFFYEQLYSPAGRPGLEYMQGRRIGRAAATNFGLGFAPDTWDSLRNAMKAKGYTDFELFDAGLVRKGKSGGFYDTFRSRLMFPVIDVRGNVIGFGGRKMEGDGPKYYNSPDTPVFKKTKNLFALNFAKKGGKLPYIIICEGYMDVIAMHQAGFTQAVASLGTSLTADQCRLAAAYTDEAVLAYDSDEAGQKATRRAIGLLDEAGIRSRVLSIPNAKDPDEFIKKFGGTKFKQLIEGSAGAIEYELDKIGAKYETDTPEGKIAALKEAVNLLAEMKNPLEREVWAAKLAADYGTTKEGILSQVKAKLRRRAKTENQRFAAAPTARVAYANIIPEKLKNPAAAAAEERLLGAALRNPEAFRSLAGKISGDDFVCALYKRIFASAANAAAMGYELSLTTFGEDFSLEEQNVIARLFTTARESHYTEADALDAAAAMKRLAERKTDAEIADLSGAELSAYIEKMRREKAGK